VPGSIPALRPKASPPVPSGADAERAPPVTQPCREPAFDRVARLAARAIRTPVAFLVLLDEDGATIRGSAHPLAGEWPLPPGAVDAVVRAPEVAMAPLVPPLAAADATLSPAWAGVPVRDRGGRVLGALLAVDRAPRAWTAEDVQALQDAAHTLLLDFDARAAAGVLALDAAGPRRGLHPAGSPEALAHALRTERSHLTTLLDALADGVLLVSEEGNVLHCNKAFLGLFGLLTSHSLLGLPSRAASAIYREQFLEPDRFEARAQELEEARTATFREMLPLADGRVLERDYAPVLALAQPLGHLWIYRDVTERERARSSLGQQRNSGSLSHVDELTGLHNRRGFIDLARAQLDEAVRAQRAMLVIFADLDGLKQINDRLGHQAGDRAIFEFATLLRATFRERDLVARLGGDEFVVLVTDAAGVGAGELVARLESRVAQHNGRGRRDFTIAFSTGVSTFDPAEPEPLEVLLSQADARMYAEKRRRKDEAGAP
jgi:diguanylate cyclase (GGDEF)-like protein/PAS domain S-box-containing protein